MGIERGLSGLSVERERAERIERFAEFVRAELNLLISRIYEYEYE